MNDSDDRAEKRIDLEDVRPVALDGGTAILARTYRTTSTGVEIDAGEVPVAVSGVYSPTDLRNALARLGFEHTDVERALSVTLGETATRAVAIAERRAENAEVLA
jgi:hypothetical protein